MLPRPGFVPLLGDWMPGAIRPNPTRLYQLTPGFSARISERTFGTMHVEIDADGLRERPLEDVRAADLRILAVGDSFTFGYGLEQGLSWPGRLEEALEASLPGARIAVANAGVPGYNLAQMDDMAREMLPKTNPQLVIAAVYADGFERLGNPLTALDDIVVRTSELRVARRVEGGLVRSRMYQPALVNADLWLMTHWYFGAWLFEGAYQALDALREALRPAPPPGAAAGPDPMLGVADGLGYLEHLHRQASDAGIPLAVLMVTRFDEARRVDPRDDIVAAAVRKYCESAGIPFLDPRDAVAASSGPLWVNAGDYHWSAGVNDAVARDLAAFLLGRGLVRAPPARPALPGAS